MSVLSIVFLVFFVIVAVLLILLVLAQNEEGDSLGGIFAGGSGSAFGSRSGNILTRATSVLGALFLIISLALALANRTPGGTGVEKAGQEMGAGAASEWWLENGEGAGEAGTPESNAAEAEEAAESPDSETAP
jgi:preprotein translocase subunit SecG